MEEINDLLQLLLCLILTSHIMEFDSRLAGHINLGITLTKLHGISKTAATHLFHQHPGQHLPDCHKNSDLQDKQNKLTYPGIFFILYFSKFTSGIIESIYQIRIIKHNRGISLLLFCLISEINHIIFHLSSIHFFVIQHGQESSVIHFLNLCL